MAESDTQRTGEDEVSAVTVHVLQTLYTATRSVLLYPPENPVINGMIRDAFEALTGCVPDDGSLDISILREKLVLNGKVLDESLQKRKIVRNFVELMEDAELSSITFWAGLTGDELRRFLAILSSAAHSKDSGGPSEIYEKMEAEEISHIDLDEQIFVAISKREKVVDANAAVESGGGSPLSSLKDEVFQRFLSGEARLSDVDPSTAEDVMADPERLVGMVQQVISSQGWDSKVELLPYRIDEVRGILERLSGLILQVEDPVVRGKLGVELRKVAGQIEAPELTEMLIVPNTAGAPESTGLWDAVIPLLDDLMLEGVARSGLDEYRRLAHAEAGDGWPTARMQALGSLLDRAMVAAPPEVTDRLAAALAEAGVDLGRAGRESSMSGMALAKDLVSGGDEGLCDGVDGPALVAAAAHLFENDRDDLGSAVMDKLAERFLQQPEDAKATAALQLRGLFKLLRGLGKESFAEDVAKTVSAVLDEIEGPVSATSGAAPGAGSVADEIESLGLGTGVPVSAKSIERLMTLDTGSVVKAVFESGDRSAQEAVSDVIVGMGSRGGPALIDTAQECTCQEALEPIAASLNQLNWDPTARIAAKFQQGLEGYQLVNLIELLVLLGNEDSAVHLATLLDSEDASVRLAAVGALGKLGGKQALKLLLNESAGFDVLMRSAAVKELGRFHDYTAVKRLVETITPKKRGEPPEDETVMIAACRSLGELRAAQAVPILAEVAAGGRKHPACSEMLRAAAATSLGTIRGVDAEGALKSLLKDSSMLVRSTARKALGTRSDGPRGMNL